MTLKLDPANQVCFDALREKHYPSHLNRIAAHLTLFHTLPDSIEIGQTLAQKAISYSPFEMRVSGLMNLGRGTAYSIESTELLRLHADLRAAFLPHLSAQDRQRFRPHIVVQNKANGEEAKSLRAHLTTEFAPWGIRAEGLQWWNYLGGPWELREEFHFSASAQQSATVPE